MYRTILSNIVMIIVFCLILFAIDVSFASEEITVTYIQDRVIYAIKEEGPWESLKKGMSVKVGHYIKTNKTGMIEMTLPDKSVVRLAPNTLFYVDQALFPKEKPRVFSVRLFVGKMWSKVSRSMGRLRGSRFTARTPTAVAGIRGTVFNLSAAKDKSTEVSVYDGKVGVGPPILVEGGPKKEMTWPEQVSEKKWEEIILMKHQRLHIGSTGVPGRPQSFDPEKETDEWVLWNLKRDGQN